MQAWHPTGQTRIATKHHPSPSTKKRARTVGGAVGETPDPNEVLKRPQDPPRCKQGGARPSPSIRLHAAQHKLDHRRQRRRGISGDLGQERRKQRVAVHPGLHRLFGGKRSVGQLPRHAHAGAQRQLKTRGKRREVEKGGSNGCAKVGIPIRHTRHTTYQKQEPKQIPPPSKKKKQIDELDF